MRITSTEAASALSGTGTSASRKLPGLDGLRAVLDALGALEDGVQRPFWPASTLGLPRPDTTVSASLQNTPRTP